MKRKTLYRLLLYWDIDSMANSVPLCSSLFLALSLWAFLISPVRSLTCTSQSLTNNKRYTNCLDLPTLDSCLHYTYHPSNSSLSIAFLSTPPNGGWVAWAINPNGTGMIGAQAFMAYVPTNSPTVEVKTYNLISYGNVKQENLSFTVYDMSAGLSGGSFVIYATIQVPENAKTLNQVWQVGPVSNGMPMRHAFAADNLNSKGELVLVGSTTAESPAPPPTAGAAPPPAKSGGSRISNVGFALGLGLLILIASFIGF